MRHLKLVPETTSIPFTRRRRVALIASGILAVASIVLFLTLNLNYGIDFRGGIMIEIKTPGPADIGAMRSALSRLGLGEVALQEFGAPDDVLIRVEQQPGDEAGRQRALELVRAALNEEIGPGFSERRVEFVGPKVSAELVRDGALALGLALFAMLLYIWFRFEWQFAVGAVVALVHDVVLTIGMFAITRLEFNLAIIAAILTIIGYSINDTVVVYDRIRENMRKYKVMPIDDLLDLSVNQTLSRTVMTSVTTLLALFVLYLFGGEVIAGFTLAMIWGVLIGTYSSIFVAAPVLVYTNVRRDLGADEEGEEGGEEGERPVPGETEA